MKIVITEAFEFSLIIAIADFSGIIMTTFHSVSGTVTAHTLPSPLGSLIVFAFPDALWIISLIKAFCLSVTPLLLNKMSIVKSFIYSDSIVEQITMSFSSTSNPYISCP